MLNPVGDDDSRVSEIAWRVVLNLVEDGVRRFFDAAGGDTEIIELLVETAVQLLHLRMPGVVVNKLLPADMREGNGDCRCRFFAGAYFD